MPDAATAGGSSPRLFVDRACPGLMLPSYGWLFCWNTHSSCSLDFGKVACTVGDMMRGVGLLEDALVTTRLLSNHCSRSVGVIDLRSW